MAIRITMKLQGAAELLQYLLQVRQKWPGATAAAVYVEGLGVLRRARPDVPVDTSELVNSEWCSLPDVTAPDPVAHMGYSAPYALPVHERAEVHHDVGRAGWLRAAMEFAMGGYARRLLARIIAYAKAGVTAPVADSRIPTAPLPSSMLLAKVKRHLARHGRKAEAARHFLGSEREHMRRQAQALVGAAFDKGRG